MDVPKVVTCTVRELLGMIARDMGRSESDLYLRSNPKGKVYLGKKVFTIEAFMCVRVMSYRRLGEPQMGYWEAEIDMGCKNRTHLTISMTEFRNGKSVDQLAPALSPCFSTIARKPDDDRPKTDGDLQDVA